MMNELIKEMEELEDKMVDVSKLMDSYGGVNHRLLEKAEELYFASQVLRSWIEGLEV